MRELSDGAEAWYSGRDRVGARSHYLRGVMRTYVYQQVAYGGAPRLNTGRWSYSRSSGGMARVGNPLLIS